MRTQDQWLELYSESHRNPVNKKIHNVCVPLIMLSLLGLMRTIPPLEIAGTLIHWDLVFIALASLFYLTLSFVTFVMMIAVALAMVAINVWIARYANLVLVSVLIFVLSWIGQFWGHKIEGKKPSFIQDLSFLLIGPVWVIRSSVWQKASHRA